jgi:hypothetical protein
MRPKLAYSSSVLQSSIRTATPKINHIKLFYNTGLKPVNALPVANVIKHFTDVCNAFSK